MKFVRYTSHYQSSMPTAVTMGNFDGMHRGHRSLIMQLVALAKQKNLVSTVILFEPHPVEFFIAEQPPARLMLLSDKLRVLASLGVEQVICFRFQQSFSQIEATAFVQSILIEKLQMALMLVGQDAQFGHRRQGDIHVLRQLSQTLGFAMVVPEDLTHDAKRVSSTQIRALLDAGDCAGVAALLGHPYQMCGRIIYGNQLGRTLGYPTINIACRRRVVALAGIFVAAIEIEGVAGPLYGVAHIAKRSIVNDHKPLLEVHIFDFAQDVYGRRAKVSFLHKIRDTKAVDNLDDLKQLIHDDADQARVYLARATSLKI